MPSPLDINTSVISQKAQHNTVHSQLFRGFDVPLHGWEFKVGINKVALTRANHRKNRQRDPFACSAYELGAWCESACCQLAAKLQPMSAAAHSRQCRFD